MKITVKTLKGTQFDIEVKPKDIVADVKKNIEMVQAPAVYPSAQQILIHQGKVLKDETTLEKNKVNEDSFMVIMLSKKKSSARRSSTSPAAPANVAQPASSIAPSTQPLPASPFTPSESVTQSIQAHVSVPLPSPTSAVTNLHGQATSSMAVGIDVESHIERVLDMGKGIYDRETVVHALRATSNNPMRAVNYILFGELEEDEEDEEDEVPPEVRAPAPAPAPISIPQPTATSGGPNVIPLDLFPREHLNVGSNASAGTLSFLRNNQRFQTFRTMVQANPQLLQPILEDLGKKDPNLLQLILQNETEFYNLVNEPIESEGNVLGQEVEAMPTESMSITPEDYEAVERLEAMGFDESLVMEVFIACNKNEEVAANYLLDNMHELED